MDLNGDGHLDIISGSWPGELFYFRGKGKGDFEAPVKLKDKAGNVVERYNAWHPLGDSHEESGAGAASAPGSFPYAFQPSVRTMDIVDLPQQRLLASVDVVAAAIRPFCEQNPGDADCVADLGLTKGDTPDPLSRKPHTREGKDVGSHLARR